ncbi:MAG: DUF3108 domain-containing protein [Candidatus Omnitrophica bacterium]|nr:DUF3108 domain-containing protein [Candidatus Omnitrophota bacterium]
MGETVTYCIKKFGVKVGDATLTYQGEVDIKGRKATLIIFVAKGFNFFDQEKIFMDPKSFYPMRVERRLNIFGRKEKIVELYNPHEGTVRIIKTAGKKRTEQIIKKDGLLDNIYCFIYRYRRNGKFAVGDTIKMSLPTKDITIELIKKDKMVLSKGKYDVFYMQSVPKRYRLWFDAREPKVPLRIDGAVGFGNTSMIMVEYKTHLAANTTSGGVAPDQDE